MPDVGVVFPHAEVGTDPAAIRDFVQTAEGLGYSHVHIYDHVLGSEPARVERGRYSSQTPFHEPLVLGGFIAGVTARIRIITGVLVLPQRQTALAAKQAAEVDLLSGGRLVLGVGTGWNEVEYQALGVPFEGRGRRIDEQVGVLRRLWQEETVDVRGEFHRIDKAGINPRPGRSIPVWFGGQAQAAVRRAARIGDGWFPLRAPDEALEQAITGLREELRAAGREGAGFAICGYANFENGAPQKWLRQRTAWGRVGATHISLRTTPPVLPAPRPGISARYHLDALHAYANAVFDGQ